MDTPETTCIRFLRIGFCGKFFKKNNKKSPNPDHSIYGFSKTYISIFQENINRRKSGFGLFEILTILCEILGCKKRKF